MQASGVIAYLSALSHSARQCHGNVSNSARQCLHRGVGVELGVMEREFRLAQMGAHGDVGASNSSQDAKDSAHVLRMCAVYVRRSCVEYKIKPPHRVLWCAIQHHAVWIILKAKVMLRTRIIPDSVPSTVHQLSVCI